MNISTNTLTTGAAVAFAGFALWYITRKPGGQLSAQPGQASRDSALQTFMDQTSWQFGQISGGSNWNWSPDLLKLING